MPSVPVYIRKDDFDKWNAIESKSEFISNALNNLPYTPTTQTKEHNTVKQITSFNSTSQPSNDSSFSPEKAAMRKGTNLCKIHNLPMTVYGKCLQKGCKYA